MVKKINKRSTRLLYKWMTAMMLLLLSFSLSGFKFVVISAIRSESNRKILAPALKESQDFASGDGKEGNPFIIKTVAQLNNVRKYIDNMVTVNHFELGADIDMADFLSDKDEGWEPIEYFAGVFDGKFHTIKNLWINRPNEDNIGLFASCISANIQNVKLELAEQGIIGQSFVGGIAGKLTNELSPKQSSIISNCLVKGNIKAMNGPTLVQLQNGNSYYTYSMSNVGGIVGNMFNSTVSNCAFYGSISGFSAIGGIVGHNWNGSIFNCLFNGEIEITSQQNIIPVAGVGGIVGITYNDSIIKNCFFDGTISDDRGAAIVGFRTRIFSSGQVSDIHGDIIYSDVPLVSGCYYNSEKFTGVLTHIESIIEYEDWDDDVEDYIYKTVTFSVTNSGPLNKSQMKDKSNYIDWDFIETWGFDRNGKILLRVFGGAYDSPSLLWLWMLLGCALFGITAVISGIILYRRKKTITITNTVTEIIEKEVRVEVPILRIPLPSDLSNRERQVAEMILSGKSNAVIRKELGIAEGTLKNFISRIFIKTGVDSQKELIIRYLNEEE